MEKRKHVIIGCGTAGLSALKQIREINSDDHVTMVAMEPHLPYSPTSLPYVIAGKIKESDIPIVMGDFFDRLGAAWIRGKRVDHVDVERGEVIYGSNARESFDSLLVATGSEPVLPNIPGLNKDRVLQLRTLDDARNLMTRLKSSKNAVILGAGLIGMHVAECLAEGGVKVSVVEMLSHVLPAYFDNQASGIIQRVMEEHGVTFYTDHRAAEVAWKADKVEISLEGGTVLEADMLLVAAGVKARTSFLDRAGIEINGGILVDSEMRTNISSIFAAGDVAAAKSFLTGENGMNPILPNAAEQGKVAGSNMAGRKVDYEGWLPMNSFNFFGHLAVSVGNVTPSQGDEVLLDLDDARGSYKKMIFREDKLIGAAFLDTNVNPGVFQYLIRRKVHVGKHRELLLRSPKEVSLWLMCQAERKETISLEE